MVVVELLLLWFVYNSKILPDFELDFVEKIAELIEMNYFEY